VGRTVGAQENKMKNRNNLIVANRKESKMKRKVVEPIWQEIVTNPWTWCGVLAIVLAIIAWGA